MDGVPIHYAEIDGIRVCILDGGAWCEREHGHDGPHVIRPDE
jgi:hypothetical protein